MHIYSSRPDFIMQYRHDLNQSSHLVPFQTLTIPLTYLCSVVVCISVLLITIWQWSWSYLVGTLIIRNCVSMYFYLGYLAGVHITSTHTPSPLINVTYNLQRKRSNATKERSRLTNSSSHRLLLWNIKMNSLKGEWENSMNCKRAKIMDNFLQSSFAKKNFT